MKILYLAHRIPYPPTTGDKIRSFHQIRHLSQTHALHLACLVDEKEDLRHVSALAQYCTSIDVAYRNRLSTSFQALLALFAKTSLSVASFYSKELEKKIAHRLNKEKFDRILVFSSSMAEYVRNVSTIPKVMDFVDVDSAKWLLYADYHRLPLSWIYRLEADRLARYEEAVARTFDHSIFVSRQEAALFQRRVSDRPVSVITNGVDLNYFDPARNEPRATTQPTIVFTGAMDYFPNVDAVRYFCQEVFPLIRKAIPSARFYIVGRHPTGQVKALSHQPNVVVTGSVPDVRPYLANASLAVAPLRIARGIQNKVLEAMAMGLPVVGTSQAFQGTLATIADGIRIVDTPEAFARDVVTLLEDQELQRQCSLQARNYVKRFHSWEDHGTRVESLLEEAEITQDLDKSCAASPAS